MFPTASRIAFLGISLVLQLSYSSAVAQTTTYSAERDDHNNTSAADRFRGNSDECGGRASGNPAAGNISKLPTRSLLDSGAATKLYAHFLPWFCTNAKREPDDVVRCNGHVLTGYDSNDAAQVQRQIEDMISRGLDGLIVDWYGPSARIEDETTQLVRAEAEKHPRFEFAVMEDGGAFRSAPDKVAKLIADLNYVADRYYASPAYMVRGGRPVLFFFESPDILSAAEWSSVRAQIRGNPLFIFEDRTGLTSAQSDGAFAWIDVGDNPSCGYVDDFYRFARSTQTKQLFGSAYQGFDDSPAGWPVDASGNKVVRKLDRRCGQTWLCTFEAVNHAFDRTRPLENLQIVTWNDYDEGTEIESGIDNCMTLSASIDNGGNLHWHPSFAPKGNESTVDRYRVFSSTDGENLVLRKEVSAGGAPRSLDLSSLGLPSGSQTIFVQAVGKPSIRNHIVNAGTWSGGKRRASTAAAALGSGPVAISLPADGASVTSPVRVVAEETTAATATAMQIYVDGSLALERAGVEHLDELVTAAPGPRQIAVKAWYGDGSNNLAIVNVTVLAGQHITMTSPAECATTASPVHVVANEDSAATATGMQVYIDGVLAGDYPGTEVVDALIAATPGPHQIAVKAWYGVTPGDAKIVDVVVTPTVSIASPSAGAIVNAPVHVVADESTAGVAGVMQVYLDGTLFTTISGEHVDLQVPAAPGPHAIAVKAWYGACPGEAVIADVTVAPLGPPVIVSSPTASATVVSPINVVADENTLDTAVNMQVYLDEVLMAEFPNAQHLDEWIPAAPGFHQIAVTAWYGAGKPSNVATAKVFVSSVAGQGPIIVTSPPACSTVGSPVHVVADDNTTDSAAVMQVYLDGNFVGEFTGEHVDTTVPASPGPHWIAVKAWYANGGNRVAPIYFTVAQPK